MQKKLTNKTAIVTGASKGIGKAIALALASENATVVLAARSEQALQETARQVTNAGGVPIVVPTDLTDEAAIDDLVKATKQQTGIIDILVNNAGVTLASTLQNTTTAQWDQLMAVNAKAPFILIRQAMGLLQKAQPGYIVNISSVVGVKGYHNQIAYTASKHALRGMSIALAEELRQQKQNIRVHVICPGGVATDMVANVRPDIKQDELISTEEIAELVLYLVTHKGNAVIDELHIRRKTSSPWF